MNKNHWLAELHERSVRDFVNLLSPVNGILAGEPDPRDFIYRGYGSEKYELVPSAFRGRRPPFPDRRRVGDRTNENQIRAEIEQLRGFCRLADSRGLRLPEDSQRLWQILEEYRNDDFLDGVAKGDAAWPPDELLSVLALAQHYGVPTRLLDWTRSSYVAAYFAAISAIENRHKGQLVVWAIDRSPFESESQWAWLKDRIKIVTAPAVDIPNLFAQQGLFLLFRERGFTKSAHFNAPSYENILVRQLDVDPYDRPILFKFTLPTGQAPELLRILSTLGIDGSSIFPGYAGVARALKEQLLHPMPGSWYDSPSARSARQQYANVWRRWRRNLQKGRAT